MLGDYLLRIERFKAYFLVRVMLRLDVSENELRLGELLWNHGASVIYLSVACLYGRT